MSALNPNAAMVRQPLKLDSTHTRSSNDPSLATYP